MVHNTSFADLGVMFDIDEDTAKHTYKDIMMYFFNFDGHMPNIWNDANVTYQEIEQLLRSIKERQSPATQVKSKGSLHN